VSRMRPWVGVCAAADIDEQQERRYEEKRESNSEPRFHDLPPEVAVRRNPGFPF
jgi:hypothetical protein